MSHELSLADIAAVNGNGMNSEMWNNPLYLPRMARCPWWWRTLRWSLWWSRPRSTGRNHSL